MMSMPERIKRARLEAGLSQRKLAQQVKGTEASIIRYESGQARPRPARLKAIAETTDKPIAYFLEDDFRVPSTLAKFYPQENDPRYRFDPAEVKALGESEPPYLANLGDKLTQIAGELQRLSKQIDLLLKDSNKSTKK